MRSPVAAEPSQEGIIESLRWPKVERNCSRVMTMPSFAIVLRQEIQCSSSELTNVPSMSHRTALHPFIRSLHSSGAWPAFNKQVRKWRRSFYADPVPDVVLEVQKWLSQPTEGAG